MKKVLKYLLLGAVLLLVPKVSQALTGPAVIITTGTLQPGTTNGFFVSSGTALNFNTAVLKSTGTWSITGATVTFSKAIENGTKTDNSTTTFTGTISLSNEFKPGLTSSTSGQMLLSQGAGVAPKFSFAGKILQIVTISTTGVNVQKTSTSGSYATTGLSGSFTATQVGSTVLIFVQQNFGVSGTAGTICTARITRDATDLGPVGDYHIAINDSTVEFDSGAFLMVADTGQSGAVTLLTRFARSSGTGTCIVNTALGAVGNNGAQMIVVEVGK